AFKSVIAAARWGAKRSTPYAVGSVHDFMHAKILVADEYVYVGSFNLSHSGESNAEDVVQVENQAIADICASYIDRVAARYGGAALPVAPWPTAPALCGSARRGLPSWRFPFYWLSRVLL